MNKIILSGLLLLFSSIVSSTVVRAEQGVNEPATQTRTEEVKQEVAQQDNESPKTEPFDLVGSAYQGQYEEQGVPGFGALRIAYNTGEVTAKKLVMIAIENGDLAPEKAEDEEYLGAVELQLQRLEDS